MVALVAVMITSSEAFVGRRASRFVSLWRSEGTGAEGVDPNEKPTLGCLVSVVALAVVDPNENDLGAQLV